MTILHRRILYLSFSFVFVVLAPLLVLFAKGYRVDFRHRQVYKTGLIYFEAQPRPDSVFLNNKKYSSSTSPFRITGIIPGEHQLKIQRGGYYTWTSTISVQPGVTTYLSTIQLFRDEKEHSVIGSVQMIRMSPNGRVFATLQPHGVSLFSTDGTEVASFILENDNVPKDIAWSPNNSAAIITTNAGKDFLYQEHQSTLTELPSFPDSDNIAWDQRQPQTVYILGKHALYSYDILSHGSSLLLSNVAEFTQVGDSLIVVQPDSSGLSLRERFRDGRMETWTTLAETRLQFLPSPEGYVTLLAKDHHRLFLLRASDAQHQVLSLSDIAYAMWNRKGTQLAYGNEFELSVAEFSQEGMQTTLLNRTSGGLRNVWWLDPYSALLVQQEQSVIIAENKTHPRGDFVTFLSRDVRDALIDYDNRRVVFLLADNTVELKPF